ncbi:hypothetical protein U8291_16130 [Pseudomonas sp. A2]|uniref:hypothetical protein n=1 Tax=Pseudomonas sp. A2 TaxID=107445 RepID=UPI002D1BD677|nr:hypothetical protein [Pseudomonas sp. A2]MEB3438541.1 hypothetical protein [Pseudomonas sp. A2]
MPTFDQIQSRFREFKNQENEYWGHLRESLNTLVEKVGHTLEIPNPRHLRLGALDETGKFEMLHVSIIPATQRNIDFSLQLILSEDESLVPPSKLVTNWSITRENGVIKVFNRFERRTPISFEDAPAAVAMAFARAMENSNPSDYSDIS